MMDKTRTIFTGRIITLKLEQVRLPNGRDCELEIVHHPGGVGIVAEDAEGRFCLLRQYRHVAGGWLWEIPAGKREAGEAPALTASRELLEEAGMTASHWSRLGETITSPGIFTEVVQLYHASGLKAQTTAHELEEVIEVHWLPLTEINMMIRRGDITDAKTLVAFQLLFLQQQGS